MPRLEKKRPYMCIRGLGSDGQHSAVNLKPEHGILHSKADNVNAMQTESGLSGRQRRRVKDRRSSLRTRSVESWPSLRAEGQQQSKNILVCPGAEWRKLKRILWCGVARRGGISRTTDVLYVLNSLLPPHSDERQETRGTGQETRSAQTASVRPTQCCRREASKKKSTQSSRSWTSQDVELSLSVSPEAQRRPSQ